MTCYFGKFCQTANIFISNYWNDLYTLLRDELDKCSSQKDWTHYTTLSSMNYTVQKLFAVKLFIEPFFC